MYIHSQEFIESIQPFLSSFYTDQHFTIFSCSDQIEELSLLTVILFLYIMVYSTHFDEWHLFISLWCRNWLYNASVHLWILVSTA
jgi:hypothetical protein